MKLINENENGQESEKSRKRGQASDSRIDKDHIKLFKNLKTIEQYIFSLLAKIIAQKIRIAC